MILKIKEQDRPLSWGTGAAENVQNELGISLQDLEFAIMTNETAVLNKLTYAALQNAAEINDADLDFNYKFFLDWLDNQDEKVAKDIMDDFLKSKMLGKTMQSRFDEIIARLEALDSPETKQEAEKIKKKNNRSVKSSSTLTSGVSGQKKSKP